jgi:hypothetical protein
MLRGRVMDKSEPYMWKYHQAEYGTADALEVYYAETLAKNIQLQMAIAQIKNAELVIDAIMSKDIEEL